MHRNVKCLRHSNRQTPVQVRCASCPLAGEDKNRKSDTYGQFVDCHGTQIPRS